MSFQRPFLIFLKRQDNRQPWGFRLTGGSHFNQPLTVHKVAPDSISERSGLRDGDEMIQIGRINVQDMTQEEVQSIIANSGNRLELFVIREDILRNRKENEPTTVKAVVHAQYNSPLNLYSTENIADTLAQQALILTEGEEGLDYSGPTSPPIVLQSKVLAVVKEEESKDYPQYSAPLSPSTKPPPPPPPPKPHRPSPLSPPLRHQKSPVQKPKFQQQSFYQNSTETYANHNSHHQPAPLSPAIQPYNQSPFETKKHKKQTSVTSKITQNKPSFPLEVNHYGTKTAQSQYESYQPLTQQSYQQQHYRQEQHYQQTYQYNQQQEQQQQQQQRIYQSQHTFQPQQPQQKQTVRQTDQQHQRRQQEIYHTSSQQPSRSSEQSISQQRQQAYQQQQRQQQEQYYQQQQYKQQQQQQQKQYQQQQPYQQQQKQQQSSRPTPHSASQVYQAQNTYQKEVQKHQQPYYGSSARMNYSPPGSRSPVWPPKHSSVREFPKTGFSPQLTREEGSKKFTWPPPKDDGTANYYSAPGTPTGAIVNAWHPRDSQPRSTSYSSPVPSRKSKDVAWPPPHTQMEEKHKPIPRTVYRSSGRFDDYVRSNAGGGIPSSYRAPPGTQHVEVIYE